MSKKAKQRALAERLEALYARLPTIACQQRCGVECCGPVILAVGEADRLRHATHQQPRVLPFRQKEMCGYLTDHGTCQAYALRPLICRVYGVVKRMSCPFGCVPDRWLSDHDFVALAAEVEAVAGAILVTTPAGPQPFGDGFRRLLGSITAPDALPRELADHYAEVTRGLRALHHGRIVGVSPNRERTE